jgi:Holliday junction resolvase YEN1
MLGKIHCWLIHTNTKPVCSIWFTQAQFSFRTGHAQAGENPELRSLFYKLASLLKLPIMPIFVFDGPDRPSVKRGVNVVTKPNWLTKPLQEVISAFGFQFYTVSMP